MTLAAAPNTPVSLRLLRFSMVIVRLTLMVSTVVLLAGVVAVMFGQPALSISGFTNEVAIEHAYREPGAIVRHELSGSESGLGLVVSPTGSPATPEVVTGETFHGALVSVRITKLLTRFVIGGGVLVIVGLMWIAVLNLSAFVDSNLRGSTFTQANALRLQRLGQAALAFAAIGIGFHRVVNLTLDDATNNVPGFETTSIVPGGWIWFIVGLTTLAIAKAFERGVELSSFERVMVKS